MAEAIVPYTGERLFLQGRLAISKLGAFAAVQSKSRQLGPTPISTTSGTASLCTPSISSFTRVSSARALLPGFK